MEKISSIVPSSNRLSSVDQKESAAVRPGTPSFGRPIGNSTTGFKDELTTAQKAGAIHRELMENRSRRGVDIVDNMARDFFMQRAQPVNAESIELESPIRAEVINAQNLDVDFENLEDSQYSPPGAYLDVMA